METTALSLRGFYIGIAVSLIVVLLVLRMINKNKKLVTEYDEMQKQVQGTGSKYALYTVMVVEAILLCMSVSGIRLPMHQAIVHFIVIFIGVMVQACYSIWHDSYIGLNTNIKRYIITVIIISAINLLTAVMAMISGTMIENGQLQFPFINLLCALMFGVIGAEMLIKHIVRSGKED